MSPSKSKSKTDRRKSRAVFFTERISEKTRESFMVDIQNLENKLEKCKEKHDALSQKNKSLEDDMTAIQAKEKNVIENRTKELSEKTEKLASMKDKIQSLIQTRDSDKSRTEKKLQEMKRDFHDMKETLNFQNIQLLKQLHTLEEFKVHKNEIYSKVQSLKKQLEKKKEEFEHDVEEMQKKKSEVAGKVKEDAVERLAQVASNFKDESVKEMPATLKRAIVENASVSGYITFVSKKTDETEKENKELKKMAVRNERKLEEMERKEKRMFEELISVKKIIKLLDEKAKVKNVEIGESKTAENDVVELQGEIERLKNAIEDIRSEQDQAEIAKNESESAIDEMAAILEAENREINKLKGIVWNASGLLKSSIFERSTPTSKNELKANFDHFQEALHHLYSILKY